ncbi:sensor histidine kinase [Aquiflexum gelatinilyticum]|uniref:sensor histidine kinase n=1 Tax=Aquiflexum gelatinilyticum TaxID=2961943 RepID=UPI002169C9A0|nr:histidine kinase [Aquiflexum gelatinilyticum]MCS4436019.1 histidine kinase [Aquiflexum gelatinilyticum]
MLRNLISRNNFDWLKALAAVFLWMVALAYLISFYGYPFQSALIDSAVHSLLILFGFWVLENVFKYYLPKRSQALMVLNFGWVFAVALVFAGDYFLGFFLSSEHDYLDFASKVMPVKGLIAFILYVSWAALLVFNAKIEDQIKTKERQEKIDQMAKDAELYHLRQQLQPHFLFNSLNSISALIKSQPEKAREMVLQLAEFLRGTIKKDDQNWLTVSEEKDYLNLYLDIEKVRFGHRLKVEFQIDESALEAKVPPLMIQPLLENSIKHGLYGVTGEVLISLSFVMQQNYLKVTLSNPFDMEAGQAKGTGFGLDAVKRRLYLLFGRNDLLETKVKAKEFTVNLKIPQRND